jgi:hypothetical protein
MQKVMDVETGEVWWMPHDRVKRMQIANSTADNQPNSQL